MPGLTVTEKNHWSDRIAARIDRAVERIKARHPALFDRVRREAHAEALHSLGLAEPYAELEAIQAEEAALARRKKRAQRAMIAALRGIPVDEVPDTFGVRYGSELPLPVGGGRGDRQAAGGPPGAAPGRRPGRPRDRPAGGREGRPARHGLAGDFAGPDRALWSKVAELLGDEPTPLEREALAIEPVAEG